MKRPGGALPPRLPALLLRIVLPKNTLAKRPLPNIVIVLTPGLGIGVNVMFFAGFSGMVIRPLPFAEPDRLVTLTETQPRIGATQQSVSPRDYRDWNEQNGVFERISAYDYRNVNVHSGDNPERVEGSGVSAVLFPLLGLDPVVALSAE